MSLELRLLGLLGIVAALLIGYASWAHRLKAEGRAECQASYAATAAEETARRNAAQLEATNEATRMEQRRTDALAAVNSRSAGLRRAFASAVGAASAAAPASGASAPSPSVLLSDVFGEIEQRLRDLAAEADKSRNEGSACELIGGSKP